jgi:hypothetical protein
VRHGKHEPRNVLHESSFDRLAYFRSLNNSAIALKNTSGRNRSADIDSMFDLVTKGKLAAEGMSDAEKKSFLTQVQRMTQVSSVTLGLDGPDTHDLIPQAPGIATYSSDETNTLRQQDYCGHSERKRDTKKSGIVDRRELEFSSAALMAVITSSAGEGSRRPTGIEFNQDSIQIVRGNGHAMSLASEQIGGLLVQYCIKVKIPIPREAIKSVRITSNSVILLFTKELPEIPIRGMAWSQPERLK